MGSAQTTTITVSTDVRDYLFESKARSTESYDDVLRRLLDLNGGED
jgi:predicted CopG family antitoxin